MNGKLALSWLLFHFCESSVKQRAYVQTESRQVTVSPLLVVAVVLLSVLGLASLVARAVAFGREIVELVQLNHLRTDLLHSRQENLALRQKLTQVGERVTSLELLADEVRVLARIAGKGAEKPAPAKVYVNQLFTPEATAGPLKLRLNALQNISGRIDRQIDNLAQLYKKGHWRLTYTPSIWPAEGILADRFGTIQDRFGLGLSSFHRGVDITADAGSLVLASADGLVLSTGRRRDYGKTIVVRHRFGISTVYAHLSAYNVASGEPVRRGQLIGFVGSTGRSTGPHLHYEVRVGDIPVNPMRYVSNQARNRPPRLVGISPDRQRSSGPFQAYPLLVE